MMAALMRLEQRTALWAGRVARQVTTLSCRTLRLTVATSCKIAILLCLFEPGFEEISKADGAEHFTRRTWSEETRASGCHSRKGVPPVTLFERCGAGAVVRNSRLSGSVLTRSASHVLANGVLAPMLA